MITVILNCYKRPEYLKEQVEAIRSQSVQPSEIWLWVNETEENRHFNFDELGLDRVFKSSENCKYHARFAIGLLAQTKYLALFDDDTIPGNRWFENCLMTMSTNPGILGGAGVILEGESYIPNRKMGWHSCNPEVVEVDLVGHAWFIERAILKYLWYEEPYTLENGEDIQLSYLAQKYGNVKTYCPAHPRGDQSLSSSIKAAYGNDAKASSNGSLKPIQRHYSERNACVQHCVNNGWRLVKDAN